MDDPRYFDSYSEHSKLPYQKPLLEKLLQNGYEVNDEYILTTKNFGLPITSMLLIMRDSCQDLMNLQKEADKILKRAPNPFTSIQIEKEFDVEIDRDSPCFNDSWEVKEMIEFDPSIYVSGANNYFPAEYAYPTNSHGVIKDWIFSNNQDTDVKERWIKRQTLNHLEGSSIPSINIYKSLISILEFSYSISERIIKSEIPNFEKKFNKKLNVPEIKEVFSANIMRRTGLIHKGAIGIKLNRNTAKFEFGNDQIEKIATVGFSETCAWVDEVYKDMYNKLI